MQAMKPASRPAIFLSPGATYHADRCEPLVQAVERGEVELVAWVHRGYPGRVLPPRLLPEISTVGYWNATGVPGWGLDWHRNEGIELTFVSRGRTAFLVEGERFPLESGHLTVTRPWQKHKVGDPHIGSTRLYWLILDVGVRRPDQPWRWPDWLILSPADQRRLTTLLSQNEQPVWRANREIAACFERMGDLVRTGEPVAAQSRLQVRINELLLALLDLLTRRNPTLDPHLVTTRRSVEMFLQALDDHLDQPWTLEEMAERCGLGRSRFADYCREITNMTPAAFLTQRRVGAAQRLLRTEPGLSVTEIALRCGFQSSQYFATVFRQVTGQTPRDYRRADGAGGSAPG
ncbi:MAG: AraC family transcriptional regulator [Verrucomicrobia bacterium]|nr:AraC family transcriptional regulator [Verrucomicrobiota bacterium]